MVAVTVMVTVIVIVIVKVTAAEAYSPPTTPEAPDSAGPPAEFHGAWAK